VSPDPDTLPVLDDDGRAAVADLARSLDLTDRCTEFAAQTWDGGELSRPTWHVDDFSGIPFLVDISGVEEYQHRARLRAVAGDLYSAVTPQTPGFEEYLTGRLGLDPVEFLPVEPSGPPLLVAQACADGPGRQRLVARAREADGLVIHPFMGIEVIWEVARAVAGESGAPVTVMAPPPPVTWLANDKGNFSELVRRLLGPEWVVETLVGDSAETLGAHLFDLAGRHEWVGLKRLRCASAMGNEVHRGADLRAKGEAGTIEVVRTFLERTEWPEGEEVLAVAWEETDCSPSTQLWIPPAGHGPPRLDGVYEQLLQGPEKIFVGSRPSRLGEVANQAIGDAARRLAAGLQSVGYYGRCSFDFLLLGDPAGEFTLKLTECNGRWGGTSTPMNYLDRILGKPWPPYRAQDVEHEGLVGMPFPEVLARVGEDAYDVSTGKGRFLFYNVGPLAKSGKLDVISFGETQAEAEDGLEVVLPRELGIG